MVAAYSPVPVVCQLSAASAADLEQIESHCNRPPWSRELFVREFSNRYSVTYGARLCGRLVGFVVCHTVLDEAHIVNFGVISEERGKGVGRELLTSLLWRLHDDGIRWVTLEVRKSNLAAINLYYSVGFSEHGVREKYYSDDGEDALMLRLELGRFVDLHSQGLIREVAVG